MKFFQPVRRRKPSSRKSLAAQRYRRCFEGLEPRQMLSRANLFAEFQGSINSNETEDRLAVTLAPQHVSLGDKPAYLSFHVEAGTNSPVNPAALRIQNSHGQFVTPTFSRHDLAGSKTSLVLAQLPQGNYTLIVNSQNNAKGVYRISVGLVGDVDGNHLVDTADADLIRGAYGAKQGDNRYVEAADADVDGRITAFDLSQWRLNSSNTAQAASATSAAFENDATDAAFSGTVYDRIAALTPVAGYKTDAPMQFYESRVGWVQPLSTESPEIVSGVLKVTGGAAISTAGVESESEALGSGTIEVPDEEDKNVLIKVEWTSRHADYGNALGYYITDENGYVGGLAPGDPGYQGAATSAGAILFTSISRPPGDGTDGPGSMAYLSLPGGTYIAFYLLQDGGANVWFSISEANIDDQYAHFQSAGTNTYKVEDLSNNTDVAPNPDGRPDNDADFNDMVFTVAFATLDLDIVQNGVLDEEEEENPGGYVAWNNDDDDMDGILDYQDNAIAGGDDDFLELILRAPDTSLSGLLTLSFATSKVRLWKDTQKNEEVLSGVTTFSPSTDTTVYVEGIAPSSGPRDVTITAYFTPYGAGVSASDSVNVTVVTADLDVDSNNDGFIDPDNSPSTGTDDPIEEESPGKLVLLNNDDDDGDDNPDLSQAGPVAGENDLVQALIAYNSSAFSTSDLIEHELVLRTDDHDKIRVYTGADKSGLIDLSSGEQRWTIGGAGLEFSPSTVWIEGIALGGASLVIEIYQQGGLTLVVDTVTLTVITLDLDVDSNNDGQITETDDPIEEDAPGKLVGLNDDDDDNNGVADLNQAGPIAGENNLVEAKISYPSSVFSAGDELVRELVLSTDSPAKIRIYTNPNKTGQIVLAGGEYRWTIGGGPIETPPSSVWIEGIEQGPVELELEIYQQGGAILAVDTVKLTVVYVDLVVDGLTSEYEESPGAIIWRNSDFSKEALHPEQTEPGLPRYLPDYAAPDNIFDSAYADDFTDAALTLSSYLHNLSEVVFDFDDSLIRLWSFIEWDGMQQVGTMWRITPGTPLTPVGAFLPFYIEGIDNSTAFSTDMIEVMAVAPGTTTTLAEDRVDYTVVETNLGVDGNRDTQIDFDNSHDRQLLFWFNNDQETVDTDGYEHDEVNVTSPDNADTEINGRRDLEDLAPLNLFAHEILVANVFDTASGGTPNPNQPSVTYRLYLEEADGTQLRLFTSSEQSNNAYMHVSDDFRAEVQATDQFFKEALVSNIGNVQLEAIAAGVNRYLFEGWGLDADELNVVFEAIVEYPNGPTTSKKQIVELDLRQFEDFYSRYSIDYLVGGNDLRQDLTFTHFSDATVVHSSQVQDKAFFSSDDNIVFVHGWNVPAESNNDWKKAGAETAFKRLYWQGFRGHFVEFDWPTFWNAEGSRNPEVANMTYNASEFQAYRSGQALKNFLAGLNGETHLLAHSMGNVVVAEALQQWSATSEQPLVTSYVAMQAAISAGAYGENSSDAFDISYGGFGWPQTVYDESRVDLLRHWSDGFPGGNSTYYMNGSETAASNWINLYNPGDVALDLAWKGNNLFKYYLNAEDPELPDLPGIGDDVIWEILGGFGFDIDDELWRLLPEPGIWASRYVVQYDEVNGHRYYRVPYTTEGDLSTDPQNWTEITAGLVDANGNPGALAYEILAFMSQANAEPVGVQALPNWFDVWEDIKNLGLDNQDENSIYYVGTRQNHSFQFYHDAAATWNFWQYVKQETSFDATY